MRYPCIKSITTSRIIYLKTRASFKVRNHRERKNYIILNHCELITERNRKKEKNLSIPRVNLLLKIKTRLEVENAQTNDEITWLIRYHSVSTREFSLPEKLLRVNYVYGEREGNLPRQCTQRDSQRRQEARLLLVLSHIYSGINKFFHPRCFHPRQLEPATRQSSLFTLHP